MALQSQRRRNETEPIAHTRLFRELAARLQQQVKSPAEITASMSDEQYLRNCVDSIYRAAR